ncbi:MAG: hypothetical protein WBL25_14550, partial [Anaerolineales bacterium]
MIFVNSLAEVEQLVPAAFKTVSGDALVWEAYPKGSSGVKTDINRDKLWDALKSTGWRPVRQIAVDHIWSVLRSRPAEKVGKRQNMRAQPTVKTKMKPATIGLLTVFIGDKMIQPRKPIHYLQIDTRKNEAIEGNTIVETPVSLTLNGEVWTTFMCTP